MQTVFKNVNTPKMPIRATKFFSCGCFLFLICSLAPLTGGGRFLSGLSRFWKGLDDSKFQKALGSQLTIQPGDTVVISLHYESKTVRRPWHWFYAVTPQTVLKFMPTVDHLLEKVKPKLINPAQRYGKYMMMNRGKKPGHIGLVGSLVATLMAHHKEFLPFHPLFCSAKHYIEYLSLGAVTGGRWYKLMYNKLASFCPVRAPLGSDMLMQIYQSREFTLKPKENGGDAIVMSISDWPDDIKQLVAEHLLRQKSALRSGASSPTRT